MNYLKRLFAIEFFLSLIIKHKLKKQLTPPQGIFNSITTGSVNFIEGYLSLNQEHDTISIRRSVEYSSERIYFSWKYTNSNAFSKMIWKLYGDIEPNKPIKVRLNIEEIE